MVAIATAAMIERHPATSQQFAWDQRKSSTCNDHKCGEKKKAEVTEMTSAPCLDQGLDDGRHSEEAQRNINPDFDGDTRFHV
jgi:hypothetical protein